MTYICAHLDFFPIVWYNTAMDYDLLSVKSDMERFKEKHKSLLYHDFFTSPDIEYVGRGAHGTVRKFGKVAIKFGGDSNIKIASLALLGEVAVERELDIAPVIDVYDKYLFMPYIEGAGASKFASTQKLVKLGKVGVERWLENCKKIHEVGYFLDTVRDNVVITDNAINAVDLEVNNTSMPANSLATLALCDGTNAILDTPCTEVTDDNRKEYQQMRGEIRENFRCVLRKMGAYNIAAIT